MKVKIVINTWSSNQDHMQFRSSEVWSGELEILDNQEYLTKISVIAEGQEHPICDIPFAIGIGHWLWIPPDVATETEDNDGIREHETSNQD